MFRLVLAAIAIGYLPGAVLMRLPVLNRPLRAALDAEERTFWAIILSATWSLMVTVGLALAGAYTFERLVTIDVAVSSVPILVWQRRLIYETGVRPPSWTAVLPAALVALGVWLYFPPAEYTIGGKDPGVYLNEGIQIAQRGQAVVNDPVVASVPSEFRNLFFPQHLGQERLYYGLRFMGFFIQNPDDGTVVGQFLHLFPASVAIGYGLNGLSGARQAIGAWAIAGLLAVYFLAARMFGRAVATAAAALLAINVAVVWFARYPNSEIPMQALLLAAVLAFARAADGSRGFFGAVAGCLLGTMLFLRYDVVLAIVAFATAIVVAPAARIRIGAPFGIALSAVAVCGSWYLLGPMRAYSALPLAFVRDQGAVIPLAAGIVALLALRYALRWPNVANTVRLMAPAGLAGTFVVLAVYAYFFRQEGGRLALGDAMAFRAFGWYVQPWVLALAVAGAAFFSARRFWTNPAFYLTFAAFSVVFFYKTRIVPEHFWMARRFLAIALPATLIFAVAFVHEVVGGRRLAVVQAWLAGRTSSGATPGPRASALGVVLLAAAVLPMARDYWRASAPVRHHVEYAGLIPRLERLASSFGDEDLVVVESRNAGSDLHAMALPLAYIYARHVLVLDSPAPPKRLFEQFVSWARERYDNVFFMGGGGTDLLTRRVSATPVSNGRFQVPEYDTPLNAYPSGVRQKEFEYGIYRLVPAEDSTPGPIDLAIGALDDLNVVRFHAREERPDGTPFRWTTDQSFVVLLGIAPTAREVTIWMSHGGRPSSAPTPTVEVALNDQPIGVGTPEDDLLPYTFEIPAQMAADSAASPDPARLRLRVPTWNPSVLLGTGDTRDLGVVVTRVEVR